MVDCIVVMNIFLKFLLFKQQYFFFIYGVFPCDSFKNLFFFQITSLEYLEYGSEVIFKTVQGFDSARYKSTFYTT